MERAKPAAATLTAAECAAAREPAGEFAKVCQDHDLGEPGVMARWIAAFGEVEAPARAGWEYLARLE